MMANHGFDDDTLTEDEIDSMIGLKELEENDSYYQTKEKLEEKYRKQIDDIIRVRIKFDAMINTLLEDAKSYADDYDLDKEEVILIVNDYRSSYGEV